jgi:response regulator RpfG family c-di-GMP phosphodiesterase
MSSPADLRVLIVDDEVMVLRALRRDLSARSYQVFQAECYDEALKILQGEAVDVVISDCTMPGPNGVEVLRASARIQPTARRFMCSAYPPADLEALLEQGVIQRFFAKPWDKTLLDELSRIR